MDATQSRTKSYPWVHPGERKSSEASTSRSSVPLRCLLSPSLMTGEDRDSSSPTTVLPQPSPTLRLGISRDNWHKRRKMGGGGKRKLYHKKRKYELGRPAANTKIGPRRIHTVRVRGVVRVPLCTAPGPQKGAKLTPEEEEILNKKRSKKIQKKHDERKKNAKISSLLEEQFQQGKLLACIASRPGQCGRADGYVLEGKELEFYLRKIKARKGK
ncbi:40S ribosomal protein S8 [Tupaia chinensis]|uniref:40S ribosomal protein S8 n=1 Tax=Tupaia chinensis TaxID=246437 RepID=L9KNE6_TUPCH|nr:40S ribosomal protein S8 [Tupaia chinensis]